MTFLFLLGIFEDTTVGATSSHNDVRGRIKLKWEKLTFSKAGVTFHGHTFIGTGIRSDSEKVCANVDLLAPNDVKGMSGFSGKINCVIRFLSQLTELMWPIRRLTRRTETWTWTEGQQLVFDRIKQLTIRVTALAYCHSSFLLCILYDRSQCALACFLIRNGTRLDLRTGSRVAHSPVS